MDIIERLQKFIGSANCERYNVLREAIAEILRLRTALKEMVYETTCLSPEEDDGSHKCKISGGALKQARAALVEQLAATKN